MVAIDRVPACSSAQRQRCDAEGSHEAPLRVGIIRQPQDEGKLVSASICVLVVVTCHRKPPRCRSRLCLRRRQRSCVESDDGPLPPSRAGLASAVLRTATSRTGLDARRKVRGASDIAARLLPHLVIIATGTARGPADRPARFD
jgi:hypothetical protein